MTEKLFFIDPKLLSDREVGGIMKGDNRAFSRVMLRHSAGVMPFAALSSVDPFLAKFARQRGLLEVPKSCWRSDGITKRFVASIKGHITKAKKKAMAEEAPAKLAA